MQNFLNVRFILAFVLIGVATAGVSALLFNPQVGFFGWICSLFSEMTALRFAGVALTILSATGVGYIAARLGADPAASGFVPIGSG